MLDEMTSDLPASLSKSAFVISMLAIGACSSVSDIIPDSMFDDDESEEHVEEKVVDDTSLIEKPPTFKIGDAFSFNNPDMTWSVMELADDNVHWQNDSGDVQTTSTNPLLPAINWKSDKRGEGRRIISAMQGSFFPLEIGNQVLFKTTVNTDKPPYAWEFDWTCDFISQQKTTVPAGTFDTYQIDCYRQKPERWSFFYAPKVGYYVKMESNNASNPTDVKIRELVSFKSGGMASETMMEPTSETSMAAADMENVQTAPVAPAPAVITLAPTSQITVPAVVEPAAPVVAAPAVAPVTGYGVHVESFKNPNNVDVSWRRLQQKYPNQLAGFQKIVKRVDLGAKGVFDRLIIGPLGSKESAQSFCASLKTLGQKYCRAIKL